MKRNTFFILCLIVVLATSLRIYRVLQVPPHLYWDETSIAYNAFSIDQTGKDEWGKNYPLLFKSFGDNKQPLYIYTVALFQKFVGPTDLSVRLPSVFAGIFTVLVSYFLVWELVVLVREKYPRLAWVKNPSTLALLASFFMAMSPWHLQFSRPGFEANLALFFRTLGTFLYLLAVRKNLKFLLISIPSFIAAMYTYHSAALTAPLILGLLTILFHKKLLANLKITILSYLLGLLILLPYLPTYVFSATGRIRFNAESVANMPGNVLTNIANNYVANFSTDFLFFKGDQNGRHSVKTLGELYLWQLPTILAGVYFLVRFRTKTSIIIIGWLLFAALPPALTRVSPHALRDLLAVRSWLTISALGLVFLLSRFSKFRPILYVMVISIVSYSFLTYIHLYFVHYPKAYAPDWQDGQRQAMQYLIKVQDRYDRIFVSDTDLEPIYVLWYLKFDPNKLFAQNHDLTKIGKFEYVDMSKIIPKLKPDEKDLLVAPAWMGVNLKNEPLRQIDSTFGKPMFRIYEY